MTDDDIAEWAAYFPTALDPQSTADYCSHYQNVLAEREVKVDA